MRSWSRLYEKAIAEETRRDAVTRVLRQRRRWREARKYLADPEAAVRESLGWIEGYRPSGRKPVTIIDGGKERQIVVPSIEELVAQHCAVEALKPAIFCGMYRHSYASIPAREVQIGNGKTATEKRGAHEGKRRIERWIRVDPENTRYVLKLDIRKFFASIPQDRLAEWCAGRVRDSRMNDFLRKIISSAPSGIPLGYYTSQWLSTWYLQDLDHFIKQILHVRHYARYADDMALFGNCKARLWDAFEEVRWYLAVRKGLEVKGNWQVFPLDARPLDYMGFRFHRGRTTLRKSIMLAASRKAARIGKKGRPTSHDARQMASYFGWLGHSQTYGMAAERIFPNVTKRECGRAISLRDRRNAA